MREGSVHAIGFAGDAIKSACDLAHHVKKAGLCETSFIAEVFKAIEGVTNQGNFVGTNLTVEGVIPGMSFTPGNAFTAPEIRGGPGFVNS